MLEQLIIIGGSLWLSATHKSIDNQSDNGMIQYDMKTNKIVDIIQYPDKFQPCRHCCREYKQKIYLIDGEHGEIILFDPTTKEFTKLLDIVKIGKYPSAVLIADEIHIVQGQLNASHLVYNITSNTIKILNNDKTEKEFNFVCALNYQDKIIQFGGWDCNTHAPADVFMISSEIKEDMNEIEWFIKPEYKLKKILIKCGYVLCKHFIITFGGSSGGFEAVDKHTDAIYVLDLNSDVGWLELKHIKCPFPGRYLAVLAPDNMVHLLTEINGNPWWKTKRGHYSIPISTILGSKWNNDEI